MKLFFLTILLSFTYMLSSQNLVHNGSMEEYIKCPNNTNQLHYSKGWFGYDSLGGSCEYFNICDSNTFLVGVPKNIFGYQYPRSGNSYSGFGAFHKTMIIREFPMTQLTKPMIKNKYYFVSFYLSLANPNDYAIQDIGVSLSRNRLTYSQLFIDTINPSIINNLGVICDTLNWVRIKGKFKSKGNERYLTIGNFYIYRPVIFKKVNNLGNAGSYYYLDDISIYPCDAPVSKAQTINDTLICQGNTISPGLTQVEPNYKAEYEWLWYKSGSEEDTLSTEQFPVFQPDTTTSYVLKLTDFKYDITYDTVNVEVVDCKQPTSLKVYPNPTHDVVYFAFDSPIPQGLSIELYNLMGQKVKGISYKPNKESKLVDINLQTLPTGIYFYRVLMEDEAHFSGKIIKI